MSIDNIKIKLKEVEEKRNSKTLLLVTGGARFGTQIALDSLYLIKNILEKMDLNKDRDKISLLLRTQGGHTNAPWPIINLIREYCKEFEVIVIDKAMSAGTQICLGADKIIMPPHSALGPIDPRTITTDGVQNKVTEVEDIINYFDFGKEKLGLQKNSMIELVKELNKQIKPTELGSIYRTHSLIREISKKSLLLHNKKTSFFKRKKIVKKLTSKLYAHDHFINRNEAKKDIGFGNIIEFTDDALERLTEEISLLIYTFIGFRRDNDVSKLTEQELQNSDKSHISYTGLLMSTEKTFAFKNKITLSNKPTPNPQNMPNIPLNFDIYSGWEDM